MKNAGVLAGGPADGALVDIDPRAHRWVVLDGHWYLRDRSNEQMLTAASSAAVRRGERFVYRHSITCCVTTWSKD
ncbi:hypothetical protein [Mycobacterium sp. 1245111.1]|uniref:hypothetical protein n=1 Tax=Mycobacterium sp. 1245111.1 TaxID=1834073 RepID=UPI000A90388D|nr:hypothetical protein [Mycobacterium sp. 1245111.1]